MIVRILGEGQFDIPADEVDTLNVLDAALEAAVAAEDGHAFVGALEALLGRVRAIGVKHELDSLDESDAILPPAGATLDEVAELLNGDGLIPG